MLIFKIRQRGAAIVETDLVEIVFSQETPLAFRRKDHDNRAFLVNRRLMQFDKRVVDSWLNGQDYSIVSENSVAESIKTKTGDAIPNTAPIIRFFTPNTQVVANGGFPFTLSTNGTASLIDDNLPSGNITFLWKQISGPGVSSVTFSDPTVGFPSITFPTSGIYVIRLTADDGELSGYAEITVDINK